ncbi:winged helix-turn-helix domain-containing protein [Sphingomonas sp. CARO-RG-8B-R24-01]|uniref:winged helix-turn-helix domain-containing protein n=1 Tax=Sphingomonas sp. CARO-RG-8B-R24-01 TaxID=2914831 RepID=UPI001F570B2D|nr:winged helix-turn-helix domain-containing protein [Sphingomonas sp. CARO-RG-8B-R24-01]
MTVRTQWQIGAWTFDADSARLIDGEKQVPLEHRAARTLELLCRDRGRPVSREAILRQVWSGRSVSANSVAVVIADLRRALGDDAAAPRFIATIPKRGYRLGEEAEAADALPQRAPAQPRARWRLATACGIALLAATVFIAGNLGAHHTTVVVTRTANDTGQAGYQPLATALHALITDRLAERGMDVVPTDRGSAPVRRQRMLWLRSRLILWNGISTLSLESIDASGHVTWSAMAVAPPNGLASETIVQLKRFDAKVRGTDQWPWR